MSHSTLPRKSALLVIDAQQSFTRMSYWTDKELPQFLQALQRPAARFEKHAHNAFTDTGLDLWLRGRFARIVDVDACLASL